MVAKTPRKPTPAVVVHFTELLEPFGVVRVKRMFGGHGFYVDGSFVAIEADQRLYFKSDDCTREAFVAAACQPFEFVAQGRTMTTSYWSVPAEALDSIQALAPWFKRALDAALRAKARQPPHAKAHQPLSTKARQPLPHATTRDPASHAKSRKQAKSDKA